MTPSLPPSLGPNPASRSFFETFDRGQPIPHKESASDLKEAHQTQVLLIRCHTGHRVHPLQTWPTSTTGNQSTACGKVLRNSRWRVLITSSSGSSNRISPARYVFLYSSFPRDVIGCLERQFIYAYFLQDPLMRPRSSSPGSSGSQARTRRRRMNGFSPGLVRSHCSIQTLLALYLYIFLFPSYPSFSTGYLNIMSWLRPKSLSLAIWRSDFQFFNISFNLNI